jgi:hypothetical protein
MLQVVVQVLTGLASVIAAGAAIWSAWNASKTKSQVNELSLQVKSMKKD